MTDLQNQIVLKFVGSCGGWTDGLSCYSGCGYTTTGNGYVQEFYRSKIDPGQNIVSDNQTYKVIENTFMCGKPNRLAHHKLVLEKI